MATLTAIKVKSLKLPGKYGDGNGLFLNIAAGGSKSWIQRITVDGKRRDLGLGSYPVVTLAGARESAAQNKRSIRQGSGPVETPKTKAKRTDTTPTFREAALTVHALNSASWSNPKTVTNWLQRAEKYVFPVIGDEKVTRIDRTAVLSILTPVWTLKPETARRIRLIIRQTMGWAMAYGYITVNPAGELIDAALPSMPKVKEHFTAVPYLDLAAAIKAVDESTSFPSTKLAFKFLVLTACRSGEVRGATWDEIDLDRALWTIPGERMKMGKDHRVPLSTAALDVLRAARELPTGGSPWVFPNDLKPEKPLSENALSYMLNRVGIQGTAHGCRSSFRDWAAENTDASFAVMELALAHGVGNAVVQSYARTDLLERRKALMESWGNFLALTTPLSTV